MLNLERLSVVMTTAGMLVCHLLMAPPGHAQAAGEEKKLGWSDAAELSFVTTAGNAEASTLGLRNTLTGVWPRAELKIEAGALRARTSTSTRLAIGPSPSTFTVVEESESRLTAENYFFRGKYDRKISPGFFWYVGAGWDRNEFAGIRNRTSGSSGVGNVWFENELAKFRTDYGVSLTHQEGVSSATGETFAGARFSSDYQRKLTSTTTYASILILDQNVEDREDLRLDVTNSLALSMTESLALKLSLQLLFDNQPSAVALPLQFPRGVRLGPTVLVPVDKLDAIFNVALVVNFPS